MSANLINNFTLKQLNYLGISKKTMTLFFDCNLSWVEQNLLFVPTAIEVAKLRYLQSLINNQQDYTFQLGYRYFFGLKLFLLKGVFVPQFDTEGLVDLAFKNLNPDDNLKGFEVGYGSGAISLALAKNSNWSIDAIDSNYYAYLLAIQNQTYNFEESNNQIKWINCDFFLYESTKKYDFIVSNPPYIDKNDVHVSEWVISNQPHNALFSGDLGLNHYRAILEFSKNHLASDGMLFLEFGFKQKDLLFDLFKYEPFSLEFYRDLNNNWRFVILKKQ